MLSHTFLATQLRTATDSIKRALAAIEADQLGRPAEAVPDLADAAAALPTRGKFKSWEEVIEHYKRVDNVPYVPMKRVAITNVGSFDVPDLPAEPSQGPSKIDKVMALAHMIQRVSDLDKLAVALTERVDNLTKILLDVAPDACARHDLFGF
jgi:hypothetical protein